MTLMAISLLMNIIKNGPAPFFIRPATNAIVGRVVSPFLAPNFKAHHTFLEDQLKISPNRGQFLCGKDLTSS
jgi:glutathione S-transferase